jgi:putative oxidoreductase
MNIVKQIPVTLLALIFFVFGLAYFLKLIPTPEIQGDILTFMNLFESGGYMKAVKAFEVLGGLLLFIPRTRGIGLCIITPIVVNIILFELTIAKQPGIGFALLLVNIIAIYFEKDKFKSLLA